MICIDEKAKNLEKLMLTGMEWLRVLVVVEGPVNPGEMFLGDQAVLEVLVVLVGLEETLLDDQAVLEVLVDPGEMFLGDQVVPEVLVGTLLDDQVVLEEETLMKEGMIDMMEVMERVVERVVVSVSLTLNDSKMMRRMKMRMNRDQIDGKQLKKGQEENVLFDAKVVVLSYLTDWYMVTKIDLTMERDFGDNGQA